MKGDWELMQLKTAILEQVNSKYVWKENYVLSKILNEILLRKIYLKGGDWLVQNIICKIYYPLNICHVKTCFLHTLQYLISRWCKTW